jgi:hypothetical protein
MNDNITLYYSVDNLTYSSVNVYARSIIVGDYEQEDVVNTKLLGGYLRLITRKRRVAELEIYCDATLFNVGKMATLMTFNNTEYKRIKILDSLIPFSSDYTSNNSYTFVLKDKPSIENATPKTKLIKVSLIEFYPTYL